MSSSLRISPKAHALLQGDCVRNILFSEGTYQALVVVPEAEEEFWPFLQLTDAAEVIDSFCSCSGDKHCDHIGAAYLFVTKHQHTPLHVTFRESFWNALFHIGARRHGYNTDCLEKTNASYIATALKEQRSCVLTPISEKGETLLSELIDEKVVETEETSIKFSNLSHDELALWRKGTPSHALRFELSFWSDIAKQLFLKVYFGESYSIDFERKEGRIKYVHVYFNDLRVSFYIAEANWNTLIPTLKTVKAPYTSHDIVNVEYESILYDKAAGEFLIFAKTATDTTQKSGAEYGKYVLYEGDGFYPKKNDPLLEKERIEPRFVHHFLDSYPQLLHKYCENAVVHDGKNTPRYSLWIDENKALHVEAYLFEKGDLTSSYAKKFGSWAYIEEKGFFALSDMEFSSFHMVIAKEGVADFILAHKNFLQNYPHFQVHIAHVDTKISYAVDLKKKTLSFHSETLFFTDETEGVDFGSFVYLRDKGFYAKKVGKKVPVFLNGAAIKREEIAPFITSNKEDLEVVPHFFAESTPIKRAGIDVTISKEGLITVSPSIEFNEGYAKSEVYFFDMYTFAPKRGFCEIPYQFRMPSKYAAKKTIDAKAEAYFVTVELPKLHPHILHLDKRLKSVESLQLKIEKISKKDKLWEMGLYYQTPHGTVSVASLLDAYREGRSYLASKAGLLFFNDPRLKWLKEESFRSNGELLELSTLSWIKLSASAEIKPPRGNSPEANESRKLFHEMKEMVADSTPDLSLLKSLLRPYQVTGVAWLWYLYTHGISGLLCDEMGLGKTHQAMALIAAAFAQKRGSKFLVVCPTSVLFHWEDLLSSFFPAAKVLMYHGSGRSIEQFTPEYDILLTSYGTLRSEDKEITGIRFSIAVYDEIQVAKNHHSQTHKVLTKVKADMRLGLTGTPIENKIAELKALFDIVLPGYFLSHSQFKSEFIIPIEKNDDPAKKALLARLISPFLLRRKKTEVLKELPEKIEEIAYAPFSDEQKQLYKEVFVSAREKVLSEIEKGDSVHAFALLTKMKRICNHPALALSKGEEYDKHSSGKWDLFVELIREIRDSGQKVVVFSQYLEMLDIMAREMERLGIVTASIRGDTRDRKEQLKKFKENPECMVFLASLKAVGVGVDLVSASVVIHYDRWWNPAVENQATDRVHRFGQKKCVQVFKLVTRGSIEEHIDRLIERKKELTKGVLGYDEEAFVKKFSADDLKELLLVVNDNIPQ